MPNKAGVEENMINYLARLIANKPGQMRVDLKSFRWQKQNNFLAR